MIAFSVPKRRCELDLGSSRDHSYAIRPKGRVPKEQDPAPKKITWDLFKRSIEISIRPAGLAMTVLHLAGTQHALPSATVWLSSPVVRWCRTRYCEH